MSAHQAAILPKSITTLPANSTNVSQQQITNCVKLKTYSGSASSGGKCVKLEPVVTTTPPTPANITIITASKPVTVSKVPVIKMPKSTTNTTATTTPGAIVKTGLIKKKKNKKWNVDIFFFLVTIEVDPNMSTNVKRIATVYPNNTNTNSGSSSLGTGALLKTFNGTNSMTSPPAKRRRSESSTNYPQLLIQPQEISTVTLDQLKVQYGNISVSILITFYDSKVILFLNRKKH